MPFKLICFYPTDTFMVKVKVTEFLTEIENFENFVKQFTYLGYNYFFLLEICCTVQLY